MPQRLGIFSRTFSALKRAFSVGSLGASFFGTSGGVTLEGAPTAELPLLQVPAFAKVIRAITRNVAQVPFQVGEWKKPKDTRDFARHWERGYGRAFAVARPVEALKRQAEETIWVPAVGSPLQNLFDRPSPYISRYQLWEAIETYLLHDGEAFVHFLGPQGAPGAGGILKPGDLPSGIELLQPGKMAYDPQTGAAKRWMYTSNTGRYPIEFFQVCRPSTFNIYNPTRGLSLREVCAMSINSIWSATRFNRALMENGGYPGGIIKGKSQPTAEQRAQLRQSFEDAFAGPTKAARIFPLWGDLEYTPLSYNHRAMQFAELLEHAEQDIRGVYKVPESEISEYENTSYASSETGRRSFWEATIMPDLRLIEDALWTTLFGVYEGGRFEGRFDLSGISALQESRAPKITQAQQLFTMGYSPNTINQYLGLGLPEIEGGDQGYLGAGLIPVGSAGYTTDYDTDTGEASPTEGQDIATTDALDSAQIQAAFQIVQSVAAGTIPRDAGIGMLITLFNLTAEQAEAIMGSAGTSAPTTPNPKPASDTPQDGAKAIPGACQAVTIEPEGKASAGDDNWAGIYWRAWIGSIFTPQEKSFGSKYSRYVMDLRSATLRKFEAIATKRAPLGVTKAEDEDPPSGLTQDDVDEIMFEREKWDKDLGKRMLGPIKDTVGKAIKRRAKELALPPGFLEGDDAVAKFVAKKDVMLVEQVNGTLAEHTRRELLEGIANSESVAQLSARLRDVFNNASNRAGTVARTETLESAGWATYETDKRSDVVEQKEWLDSQDNEVRDDHRKYGAMGAIPFDAEWAPGLKYPGDTNAPIGTVANCRCTYLPILKDEEKSAAHVRAVRFARLDLEEQS